MPTVDLMDVQQLVRDEATRWVSLLMPTERSGPDTRTGATRLSNLAKEAQSRVPGLGEEDLSEVQALVDSSRFWQHQLDGLAIYLGLSDDSPARTYAYQVPIRLPERVVVAEAPHLQPLAPLLAGDELYYVLVLSQQSARLFEATRHSMDEVDPGTIPTSVEDLPSDRDHQAHLQFTGQGGGDVSYHGHGADARVDEVQRDKYFRAVAAGLAERLQGHAQRVVLATVEDNASAFRAISDYPGLAEEVIAGSWEHASPAELAEAAQPVGAALLDSRAAQYTEHLEQMRGADRVSTKPGTLLHQARNGRVDTLFISVDHADGGQPDTVIDQAIMATWANGGDVAEVPARVPEQVIATLRY